MIYIDKNEAPDFLSEYVRKNPKCNYDSKSFAPFIQKLRSELVKEQKGLCAYCCSKITVETSHNEHIEPRHKKDGSYSKRSLDYYNIVASCNSPNTCGNYKGNKYDADKFVSPLNPECEEVFTYDYGGYIKGDEYTISLLNLNSYALIGARKAVLKSILPMDKEDIKMVYLSDSESYQPFYNVISWFIRDNET